MADIPSPENFADVEKVFEALPITLNVGFPTHFSGPGIDTTVIGWANAFRSKDTLRTTIVMTLDEEASESLKNLDEVFKLYSMGFAGIKRTPQDAPKSGRQVHAADCAWVQRKKSCDCHLSSTERTQDGG